MLHMHVLALYRANELVYAAPQPIEPRDELAELLRESLLHAQQATTGRAR